MSTQTNAQALVDVKADERRCHCCGEPFARCRVTYRGTSSQVNLMAVLDRQLRDRAERANRYSNKAAKAARKLGQPQITADRMSAYENLLFSELREAHAAVAELIVERDALRLALSEYPKRNPHQLQARKVCEGIAALARIGGAAPVRAEAVATGRIPVNQTDED